LFHPARSTFIVLRAFNRRACLQPKLRAALLGLSLPYRVHHLEPMPSRRSPGWSDDTSSRGLFLPYDTVPGQRIRVSAADPSTATRHVRGLVTPCATITTGPPDAYASERPWASPFKVFPSSQAVPLSGSLPSCHYPLLPNTPRSARLPRSRLQGLVPATNPCSRRNHEWFRPSIPSWGSTLQSLLPLDLAHALIAAPPLSLLGGLTSRPA